MDDGHMFFPVFFAGTFFGKFVFVWIVLSVVIFEVILIGND